MNITLGDKLSMTYAVPFRNGGGTRVVTTRDITVTFGQSVQTWLTENGLSHLQLKVVALRGENPGVVFGNYPKIIDSTEYWGLQTGKLGLPYAQSFMQGTIDTMEGDYITYPVGKLIIDDVLRGTTELPYSAGQLNLINPNEVIRFAAFIPSGFDIIYVPNTLTGTYTLSQLA